MYPLKTSRVRVFATRSEGQDPRGFTLIELLIVIGMLAILATVVLVAVNPLRHFAQARNSQRESNVAAILNAVSNRIADNRGIFAPEGDDCEIPEAPGGTIRSNPASASDIDLRHCLVPTYISELPFDPSGGDYDNTCDDIECTDGHYDTGYTISQAESRVTVCAPESVESALNMAQEDMFCLTR